MRLRRRRVERLSTVAEPEGELTFGLMVNVLVANVPTAEQAEEFVATLLLENDDVVEVTVMAVMPVRSDG